SMLLAAGGPDKTVRLYTFADGKQQAVLKTLSAVRSLAFSPNSQVLAAGCDDRSLLTWNVVFNPGQPAPPDFGKPGQSFAHSAAITAVAFQPNNAELYSSGLDKVIKNWKLASDQPIKNLGHP